MFGPFFFSPLLVDLLNKKTPPSSCVIKLGSKTVRMVESWTFASAVSVLDISQRHLGWMRLRVWLQRWRIRSSRLAIMHHHMWTTTVAGKTSSMIFCIFFFCSRIDLGVFFVQVTLDVWAAPGCPDPLAVPGVLYPNYIGAFCHKWFASRWSTCDLTQTTPRCCGLFNGGANAGRDKYPFPESLVFSCIFLFGRVLFFGWPTKIER